MSIVAGIDVGGTFTDLVLFDAEAGTVRLAKTPTTPENQAVGVLAALDAAGVDPAQIDLIVHGTTTTTNAVLERRLARTGLITTAGFRDVLELGRRTRPRAYGMTGRFTPVIPRDLRLEVPERMDARGRIITPLDEAAVRVGRENRDLLNRLGPEIERARESARAPGARPDPVRDPLIDGVRALVLLELGREAEGRAALADSLPRVRALGPQGAELLQVMVEASERSEAR